MRIGWVTDIHLSVCSDEVREKFYDQILAARLSALWVGGDIGEADNIVHWLRELCAKVDIPVYCVLGNHDYYFGSIRQVRENVALLCQELPNLHYLSQRDVVAVTDNIGLIGHDGWADGRNGNYETSMVMMNDYRHIEELAPLTKQQRLELLHQLGDEAARHIGQGLRSGLQQYSEVYVVTHIPPVRGACWYEGQIADDEWAPHFTCHAVGVAILEIAAEFPSGQVTVLCGHTHSPGICQAADNVVIHTAAAEYERPQLSQILEF